MKMIGWDDEFGGAQVGMAWLWGILSYLLGSVFHCSKPAI